MTVADLTGIVNASGFMFQIAVENTVKATRDKHGFDVEAREHPWKAEGESGFIDLILRRRLFRVVCECKRSRDANWVFPAEEGRADGDRARLYWCRHQFGGPYRGCFSFSLATDLPESGFCLIRGHGENDTPLLERIASKLMMAVEALAAEEARLRSAHDERDNLRVYVPLIVTTARLWVCRYRPDGIDLTTGLVRDPEFNEVPAIRFRKALTMATAAPVDDQDDKEMAYTRFRQFSREQERTILIVNAGSLVSLLTGWCNGVIAEDSGYPPEWPST